MSWSVDVSGGTGSCLGLPFLSFVLSTPVWVPSATVYTRIPAFLAWVATVIGSWPRVFEPSESSTMAAGGRTARGTLACAASSASERPSPLAGGPCTLRAAPARGVAPLSSGGAAGSVGGGAEGGRAGLEWARGPPTPRLG